MNTALAALCTAGAIAASNVAIAADKPASPHTWDVSAALRSDYVFRGMTRSNEDPAIQGAFGYRYEPYGFHAGVWASSTELNTGTSDDASLEVDFHGGFSGAFSNGVHWDVGGRYYYFPDQNADAALGDFEMFEVNGAVSYTFDTLYSPKASLGVAYSPDYFGEDDDGWYVDGGLEFALPHRFGFYTRAGYLDVEGDRTHPGGYDYAHYAVGLTRAIGTFTLDLGWQDAGGDCDDIASEDYCEALVFGVSSAW